MLYRMTVDFNGIGLNETREELKDNKWVVVDKFHPNAVFQGTNTIEVSNGHIRLEKYFVRTDDCRIPERREYSVETASDEEILGEAAKPIEETRKALLAGLDKCAGCRDGIGPCDCGRGE